MYDVTRPQTFKSIEKWYQLMSDHGRGDVEVALVGNKCDLNSDKKVDSKQGENTATELGCHFYESSAKGDFNCDCLLFQHYFRQFKYRKCIYGLSSQYTCEYAS